MFGLFKRKRPTVMDGMIRLVYGDNPPPKSADLERSIAIAYRDLLCERVPFDRVKQRASELFKGPNPYSTLDLAASTALGFFMDPEYMPALQECQIGAGLRVADWAKDGSVPRLLAQSFEDVLYRRYKPQPPEAPDKPQPSKATERPVITEEVEREIISLVDGLLTVQLMGEYKRLRDAFPALMTNKLAAGYVFGFQDCCLKTLGFVDSKEPEAGSSLIRSNYQSIFGDEAGWALYKMSIDAQMDSEQARKRSSANTEPRSNFFYVRLSMRQQRNNGVLNS
jgi:hypothetical protein